MAVKGAVFTSEYLLLLGTPQALTTKQDSKKERNQKRHHSLAWLASHAPFFLAWLTRNGNEKLLDVGSCVALVQPFVLEVIVIIDLNNRRLVLRYQRCSLSRSWLQPLQFWGKVLNICSICHDSDVGTDYFFLLLSFLPTIVPSSYYPLVQILDYRLFTDTR